MTVSEAEIATPRASRYLQQLCKHFAHKLPVTCDAAEERAEGRINFPIGDCRMQAEAERLTLTLSAPDGAQMTQLKDVVIRHLMRFAFREELAIVWRED